MTIGSKIKNLRQQNNLTQKELCSNYMNRVVLGRIENDRMLPSLEQLNYIANRLDKNVKYFISDIPNVDLLNTEKSMLSKMYQKEEYFKILKNSDDLCKSENSDDFDEKFFIGMSYYNLKVYHEAIKPLKKYINKYLTAVPDIQQKHITNFLITLNTLFKIMIENKNYIKCETYLSIALKNITKYSADNSYIGFSIYNNLAYLYLKQCKYIETTNLLEPFISNHKALIYPNILSSMCLSLNIAFYNIGNYENSIRYIKKAINLFEFEENILAAGSCYFNLINSLRYSHNFDEAIFTVQDCLKRYSEFVDLHQKFLLQEIIIYFNMKNFEKIAQIKEYIKPNKLESMARYDYYFIAGHIEHIYNKDNKKAYEYLSKANEYYRKNNYNKDLYILSNDLYEITGDEQYRIDADKYINSAIMRKNIVVDNS